MEIKWFYIALGCGFTAFGLGAAISASHPTTCCDNIEQMYRQCAGGLDHAQKLACMDKAHDMMKECGCKAVEK